MSETNADPQPSEEPTFPVQNEPVESMAPEDPYPQEEQHGVPNPDTGVGIGADGEPNTFEPEEEPEATGDPE